MARFRINGNDIYNDDSFHDEFSRVLQFFDGYGRNMDAWIDCMTDLHGQFALSDLNLPEGESIELVLVGAEHMAIHCPDEFSSLLECTIIVNQRYKGRGSEVRVALIFE